MLKIKEMQVGSSVTVTLLVKASEIKFTRPPGNKPYLYAVLTDGTDDMSGQDWDFGNNTPPAKNSVLEIKGQISEYMGKKQIKIISYSPSDIGVENFAPDGGVNVSQYINDLRDLVGSIDNGTLRDIVDRVFADNSSALSVLPAANGIHHAFVAGLLMHTVDVTKKAKAIAELTPHANVDLVTAGALLHDMGKFWTYQLNGAVIEMTEEGKLVEHIMLGAIKLEGYRTPENYDAIKLLQHIISSHHGVREWGSPTTPQFIEAIIIHFADGVDAKTQAVIEAVNKAPEGAEWTDKIWILENRQMKMPSQINKELETTN